MANEIKKVLKSIRFKEKTRKNIQKQADQENRSFNNMVETMCIAYFSKALPKK